MCKMFFRRTMIAKHTLNINLKRIIYDIIMIIEEHKAPEQINTQRIKYCCM